MVAVLTILAVQVVLMIQVMTKSPVYFCQEDDGTQFTSGMLLFALHIEKYLTRSEYRVPLVTGLTWVERKLANRDSCYKMFRMTPTMFHRLHDLLVESYGLKSSTKSISVEALGMFLWMVRTP